MFCPTLPNVNKKTTVTAVSADELRPAVVSAHEKKIKKILNRLSVNILLHPTPTPQIPAVPKKTH